MAMPLIESQLIAIGGTWLLPGPGGQADGNTQNSPLMGSYLPSSFLLK